MRLALMGCLVGTVAMPLTAMAEDSEWYINPSLGYAIYDSERDTDQNMRDEGGIFAVGVERRTGNWGIELNGSRGDVHTAVGDDEVDIDRVSVDAIRYFTEDGVQPYSSLGVGHTSIDGKTANSGGTHGNLGLGVLIPLNERLAVRTGVKYIYDFDGEYDDGQATVGFSWKVGGGTKGSTEAAPEVVEPVAGDSDRDGVADSADQCPGTPYRVAVDANGCPLDQDGDGVPNYRDRCPETAPGTKVDHRGCKQADVSTQKEELLVHFALNSAVVMPSYRSDFMRMAEFLKEHSGVSAVIEGHADHTGTLDYNQALSVRRAESVKAILVKKYGIDANRLRTIGYGETRPVASNDNAAGRQANRRAVAVVRIKSSN